MSATMSQPTPSEPVPEATAAGVHLPIEAAPPAAEAGIEPRDLDQLCVDTIRMLAVDMVNAANSGHPGMPLGAADMAYVLWTRFLRYDPEHPEWPDRDRFVLSAGHGSALLYALLHLSGHELPMQELRNFRRLHSKTPGHPEAGLTPGAEVTTGPLGQGFANAVGIAVAQRMVAARFGAEASSHRVFGICSDGDLMEGVSAEAASLAGHWGLGNLVFLYDANRITIDGSTDLAFSEDVGKRFEAYGWHVLHCDGHDRAAVAAALSDAVEEESRPSLIVARTVIGRGSPNRAGSEKSHGSPLGGEETRLTKRAYGWPDEPQFLVPREVYERFRARAEEGRATRSAWDERIESWRVEDPRAHALWESWWQGDVPPAGRLLEQLLAGWTPGAKATRQHSQDVLQRAAALVPNLAGGSADLTGSNNTWIEGSDAVGLGRGGEAAPLERFAGRNFHFGVREHAMGAIANGMAAHGAFIPYTATFLAFLDYMRPPVRLAALSRHGTIFVFSHDSVGLGEDGPTHQPIEHLWSARMTPRLVLHRPADGLETAAAWADAIARRDGPTAIVLTRQKLPVLERPEGFVPQDLLAGAHVLADPAGAVPEIVLIATGSEVGPCVEARRLLEERGLPARLVSMPSVELFDRQPKEVQDRVLPPGVPRVAVEAGRPDGWYRLVGREGLVIGIEDFGHSATAEAVFDFFGFTGPKIADRVAAWFSAGSEQGGERP